MAEADRMLGMYLHLARASNLRRQPMVRDKLLVLAGVHAQEMGLEQISALCRHRILGNNARHLVRQWPTLTAALADERFQSYLKQLKRRYSGEKIEHMLDSLGIELGREREAYFSDVEYAAALLDTKPEVIGTILAQDPTQRDDTQRNNTQQDSGLLHQSAEANDSYSPHPRAPGFHLSQPILDMLILWVPFGVGLLVLVVAAIAAGLLAE
jgi:hypothetical protein